MEIQKNGITICINTCEVMNGAGQGGVLGLMVFENDYRQNNVHNTLLSHQIQLTKDQMLYIMRYY